MKPSSKNSPRRAVAQPAEGVTMTLPEAMRHAQLHYESSDWATAEQLCRLILGAEPGFVDALNLLAIIAAQTRRFEEAAGLLGRLVQALPDNPYIHGNYGNVLRELGRFAESVASQDQAIALKPDYAGAHYNRGIALQQFGQLAAALASYDQAIAIEPGYAEAWSNRGVALTELKQLEASVASYDRAIALKPDYAEAWFNRGNALQQFGQLAAALASYDQAIAIEPGYAEAWCNRGNALTELKQLEASVASYDRAIALQPDYAEAHLHKSLSLLLGGDFEKGWALYEWRWKKDAFTSPQRYFPQPLWLGGQALGGKTILLHSEQGLGDTLQFCRYASLVAGLGATVVMEVPQPLAGLLEGLEGVHRIVAKGAELPAFDCHCPLLSLPLAFKTALTSIPNTQKYLHSDGARTVEWARRLGAQGKRRVGLVWSGSTGHANDAFRSVPLADLLAQLPEGFEYVSLQKEVRDNDQTTLNAHAPVRHFGAELKDFADTAALCELMDLVISVDTSVAHLSAAIGKPTWVLLPHAPDFRWLLDRSDSPWYASVKLYRQQAVGDWAGVFARVGQDLCGRLSW